MSEHNQNVLPGRALLGIDSRVIVEIHTGERPARYTGTIVERDSDLGCPYLVLNQDGGRVGGHVLIFLGPGVITMPAPVVHPAYADPPPHPGMM